MLETVYMMAQSLLTYLKKATCNTIVDDLQVKDEVLRFRALPNLRLNPAGPKLRACQQRSEQEVWPVIVEYLNQPG